MARDRRLNALFEKVFLQLKEAVGREVWIRTDAQYPADDIVLGRLKSVSNSADVYLDKARSGPSGPKVSGRVDLHRVIDVHVTPRRRGLRRQRGNPQWSHWQHSLRPGAAGGCALSTVLGDGCAAVAIPLPGVQGTRFRRT
jgi:hypothetical protein